ncbi:mechanosensitive ion channel domain-containing protein [Arenimonas oryziterrae]|uniref:Mechanosensitive ion channel n=1 Tax=Arenimonas oryziterrae DSM 21050 = YC6267 TaxID=1121015 RepID=A0A091AVC5_9GAMM|nr:mechanosensitive ion channel domain-containing protein [Arenimonas oryziterrae]KFN44243.1 hypothetical protein N789_07435 [Arenimonas oryziterrae DSM 21050 = YC6267]
MIARGSLATVLLVVAMHTATASAQTPLAERAAVLRASLAPPSESLAEDRGDFYRRQLLASLERRQDLQRALADARRLAVRTEPAAPPLPAGVLALDDLRSELQQLDTTLAGGERRLAILKTEREATAAQLAQQVAALRVLTETQAAAAPLALARLETELVESATAELDLLLRLVDLQQELARRDRAVLAQRLMQANQRGRVAVSVHDAAAIEQRLRVQAAQLRRRMADAAANRERVRDELQAAAMAPASHREWLKERLANADIDLELGREALSNLATEQAAWQIALRYYRDEDAAALVEARDQGPVLVERLRRRREFLAALSEQLLARIGTLSAAIAQAPTAVTTPDKRALRAVFEQRLHLVQTAMSDERRLADLIARMRADFDERIGHAPWPERVRTVLARLRSGLARAWNFELFTVAQTIDVEGRQTAVPKAVTLGKLVKAPLLLVCGVFLALRFTAWGERWLRRRGSDEGSARLMRRWLFALLVAACVLASLALAGIPLAAFAFIGGAVAIGIGFGMQALFKNLISGVLVLVERPFRLGDVIEVGDLRGTVVDIDLRTSVVRDGDGAETLIPNSALMEENVKNVTFRSRLSRQVLGLVVEAASDPRIVIDAMRVAASRHGQLAEKNEPVVFLDEFADNGLRFVLHYWIELNAGVDRRRIASDLRLMILGAFEEAGIRMAPPSRLAV